MKTKQMKMTLSICFLLFLLSDISWGLAMTLTGYNENCIILEPRRLDMEIGVSYTVTG